MLMRWPQRVQTSPSDSNNAPRSVTRRIRLTNPCDPLAGAEVEFVQGPRTRSDDWVLVKLPGGELRMVRKTWTSLVPEDGYELLAQRPLLKLEALRELADWIGGQHGRRRRDVGVAGNSERD